MAMLRRAWASIRAVFRRDVINDEISEELRFHLEMRTEELKQRGLSPAEARRAATRRFGNVATLRDRGYDVRGAGFIETVAKDVRFALHLLHRRPVNSCAAILTLALGIGLTTALISIVDAAWLRPLPFPEAEQLVTVGLLTDDPGSPSEVTRPSLADVRAMRAGSQVLAGVGQWHRWEERLVLDDGQPERVKVLKMSEGYVDLYGVPPALGRTFSEDDARPGAAPVALLGHAYWKARFGGDPGIVGRTMLIGNASTTVVGVMPARLHRDTQVWVPDTSPDVEQHRNSGADVYARVRSGVSLHEAERALGALAATWPVAPRAPRVTGIRLDPLYDEAVASTSDAVSLIVVSVLVLVALVCVNVAGLLFADGTERRREFAVRASMGAGRGRLVRQLLTEAGVLGSIAWLLGVLTAMRSLAALVSVLPLELPPHSSPALNPRVLMMTVGATAITIAAISLWPAWSLTRASLNELLSGAAQQRRRPWPRAFGRGLIAAEVALAVILLTGGGLLMRSLDRLLAVDLGFDPEAILTMEVLPLDQSPMVWGQYFPALLTALRRVPGVAAAGAIEGMPLASAGLVFMAASPDSNGQLDDVTAAGVTPGYLEALGVRVLAGRTFSEGDRYAGVVVIDATLAQRLFPGGNAIGKTINVPLAPMTVIGVVSDVRDSPRSRSVGTTIYSWLTPHTFLPPTVVIRAEAGARLSHDALRKAAHSVGIRAFVERIRPGSDLLDENLAAPRHRTALLGLLGGLGLLLTVIGTAGVTAYAVARRTQEIGIRLAFGATPRAVVRGIALEAVKPIAAGLALGLAAAYYGSGLLIGFLFQTPQHDPVTLSAVVITLSIATLLAAWLPARRAARVDPVQALRAE